MGQVIRFLVGVSSQFTATRLFAKRLQSACNICYLNCAPNHHLPTQRYWSVIPLAIKHTPRWAQRGIGPECGEASTYFDLEPLLLRLSWSNNFSEFLPRVSLSPSKAFCGDFDQSRTVEQD